MGDDEQPRHERRRQDENLVKGWVPLILTLVALIFNVGWSSSQLSGVAAAVKDMPTTLASTYVRKDVNEEQMRGLRDQINELKALVQKLQPAARTATSSDTDFGSAPRRFDR